VRYLKKAIIISILIMLSNSIYSQTPKELFDTANRHYQDGQYKESISNYESIVHQGIVNSNVFYNLGNAYFKDKQTGKAIINYERAFRLKPYDKDTRANLKFIRSMIKDDGGILFNIDILSLNQLFIIFCILTWFMVGMIILGFFVKQNFIWSFIYNAKIFFIICLILNSVWLISKFYQEKSIDYAIVISETHAKNGPGNDYSVGFSLPEGKKVIILGKENDWIAIGLKKEGLKGWVEDKTIERIARFN